MSFWSNGFVKGSSHWKRMFRWVERNPSGVPMIRSFIHPARKAGLTLIEVLLAVVILGIGSGVLMLATARCLAVVAKTRHYSTAQRLIRRVAAEHPLTRAALEEGTEEGDFDDQPLYRWEREISEPEDEEREGLYTVRTRVSWSDRGRNSFEESVTWRYVRTEENR